MKKWLENAVFYEIYPQSFNDTNADGIGDLNGVIEKLDYIKDMGFTAIWLNPCFKSPFTDAGYDIEDYYSVAPRYGTNEDIKRLFDEVHARDMHIILDLVPGHTAMTCKWFQESMKPEKNKYSGRYIWTDSVWSGGDNALSVRGIMRGLSDRDGGFAVNFYSTQPALNYGYAKITEPWQCAVDSKDAMETREAMLDVMRFWLKMGCDGFRVDMANSLVKNDEGKVETIRLWQDLLGRTCKEFPEAAFISEWGEPDKALAAGFDMDFLLPSGPSHYTDLFRTDTPYFSKEGKGNLSVFFNLYIENYKKTNGTGLICIPSGNHDTPRIAYTLDSEEIKVAYAFLMAMPGVPFIYYGDEIGMKYLDNLISVEGGYNRTGSRTPMQWDDSVNGGFSTAAPYDLYIKMDPDKNRPTVERQIKDENSILNELKRQIAVRKSTEALNGISAFEPIYIEPSAYPLVFRRNGESGSVLVAINPSAKEASCALRLDLGQTIYNFNGTATLKDGKLTVPPCSVSYIEIK